MEINQDTEINSEIEDLTNALSEKDDEIKKLNLEISEKDIILSRTKSYLFDLESNLDSANNKINSLEADLARHETEIKFRNDQLNNANSELNIKDSQIKVIESKLNDNKIEIGNLNNQIDSLKTQNNQINIELNDNEIEIGNLNNQIDSLKTQNNQINMERNEDFENLKMLESLQSRYYHQSSILESKKYCIHCYERQISDNNLEIEYLKTNGLTKKLLSPLSYLIIILKSKSKEININIKLYRALKNSKCFSIGYYLNNNKDLIESKYCKYFSPELHYVCFGFDENRAFNKKYFNRNSKNELLDYILKCI